MAVSATGQKASRVRPYFSTHQSKRSCGDTERSHGSRASQLVVLEDHGSVGSMIKPTLKNRSGQSSMPRLGLRHDEDVVLTGHLAERSVSGPGMSMAQVRAKSA